MRTRLERSWLASAAVQLGELARRHAQCGAKDAAHVRLVRKPRLQCGLRGIDAGAKGVADKVEPAHQEVAVGRGAESAPELRGEFEAREARDRLEFAGMNHPVGIAAKELGCAVERHDIEAPLNRLEPDAEGQTGKVVGERGDQRVGEQRLQLGFERTKQIARQALKLAAFFLLALLVVMLFTFTLASMLGMDLSLP